MTISCRCPRCDALCAFYDKNAGRRARCRSCGQIFIIPGEDGAKPEKVKIKVEEEQPEPGFYEAVFFKSWKVFIEPENATSLVFVTAAVCFKFFLSTTVCCGLVAHFVVWGWLLGFYLNIIYDTAYGVELLPEIYLGTFLSFWWCILKPFLIFLFTLTLVLVPFLGLRAILGSHGIVYTMESMWVAEFGWVTVLQLLLFAGLFIFPIAILTMAVSEDILLLRPDTLIKPIIKGIQPYSLTVAMLGFACFLELQTKQYDQLESAGTIVIGAHLLLNMLVQVVAVVSMRVIGLFCRHYGCYIKW